MPSSQKDLSELIRIASKTTSLNHLTLNEQIMQISKKVQQINLSPSFLELGSKLTELVRSQSKIIDLVTKRYPSISPAVATNIVSGIAFAPKGIDFDLIVSIYSSMEKLRHIENETDIMHSDDDATYEAIKTLSTTPEEQNKISLFDWVNLIMTIISWLQFGVDQVQRIEDNKQKSVYMEEVHRVNEKLDILLKQQLTERDIETIIEQHDSEIKSTLLKGVDMKG